MAFGLRFVDLARAAYPSLRGLLGGSGSEPLTPHRYHRPPSSSVSTLRTAAAAAAVAETRCAHCYITFDRPAELRHHQAQHCFPGQPEQVLLRFPVGTKVRDRVEVAKGLGRGGGGEVVGPALHPNLEHANVAVRMDVDGRTSNIPISRLEHAGVGGDHDNQDDDGAD